MKKTTKKLLGNSPIDLIYTLIDLQNKGEDVNLLFSELSNSMQQEIHQELKAAISLKTGDEKNFRNLNKAI